MRVQNYNFFFKPPKLFPTFFATLGRLLFIIAPTTKVILL